MNGGGIVALLFIIVVVALGGALVYMGGFASSRGENNTASTSTTKKSGFFNFTSLAPSFSSSTPIPARNTISTAKNNVQTVNTPGTIGQTANKTTKPSVLDNYFDFQAVGTSTEANSLYASDVTLSVGRAKDADPQKEYIIIKTSRNLKNPVTISNWTLESVTSGITAKIGEAAQLPFLGMMNANGSITLPAESTVYITTGRAPNGTSFRTNTCTGYFEQLQDFEPFLARECPTPENEMLLFPQQTLGNDQCIKFVQSLPRCAMRLTEIPPTTGSLCQEFVLNQLSYNGCITNHRYDPSFYKNEWRVFLGRSQELWKNTHERIRLLDQNGKLIGSITY